MLKRMIFFVYLPKLKQTNMKQFAFPIGVKCSNPAEYKQCIDIIKSIGDRHITDEPFSSTCNYLHVYLTHTVTGVYDQLGGREDNMYYIDHFNPKLIHDIAAACTNDTWQEGEMALVFDCCDVSYNYEKVYALLGKEVCDTKSKRPTISEICAHHGYEIKGRDIVKKVETVSNCDKSYCETARQLDEAKAEIKRLKSENDELSLKLEAMTDVDNQELARLQSKVDELSNKLQHNDKLHVKELEMLTDMITELSRDKAELIMKLNCLSASAGVFHTSRPLEFHPIPNMFQTKPAEFSEREKKRLLRLAERIERLIK